MDDERIRRNPCRIKGAGTPDTPEREVIPIGKVLEIADTVPVRYRALVLLGTFASLRWGELAGLRRTHLDEFAEQGEHGRVFVGPKGASGFRRIWKKVQTDVGLPGFHFHDLRHVGNTLASDSGVSLKELMTRMGHSSTRAALIYQHASRDRDQAIARALGQVFKKAQGGGHKKASGTPRARKILKF